MNRTDPSTHGSVRLTVERGTAKAASAKPMKLQGNTRANTLRELANCAGKHEASGV